MKKIISKKFKRSLVLLTKSLNILKSDIFDKKRNKVNENNLCCTFKNEDLKSYDFLRIGEIVMYL